MLASRKREGRNSEKGVCWGGLGAESWELGLGSCQHCAWSDGRWKILTCGGFLTLVKSYFAVSFVPVKPPSRPLPILGWRAVGGRKRAATWQVSGRFSCWPQEGAGGTAEFWGAGWGGEVAFVLLVEGVGCRIY